MKKLTKKERKSLRGPNAAMDRSMRDGKLIKMSDRDYSGRQKLVSNHLGFPQSGIPFVRL